MTLSELAIAQRQLPIRVHIRAENLYVARAIHRLQCIRPILGIGRKHIVFVVVPVTGFFPQRTVKNLRRFDFLIAVILIHMAHVLLNLLPDRPALGVPENQPRRLILKVE